MTPNYFLLGGILVSVCLLMSWMFIWSRVHYLVKVVAGSAVVGASIYVWILLTAIMGYPVHQYPHDGTIIIAFRLDKPSSEIYLWMDGKPPRAFGIPYSDKTAEGLVEAERKAQETNGKMVFRSGKPGKGGDDGDADDDDADGTGKKGKGKGKHKGWQGGFGFFDDNSEIPVTVDVKPNLPPKD